MSSDIDMSDAASTISSEADVRYFKVAIDFGTTCSSVSYLVIQGGPEPHPSRRVGADEPKMVTGFPDSAPNRIDLQDQKRTSVPSQCWYGEKIGIRPMKKHRRLELAKVIHESEREIVEQQLEEEGKSYKWGYEVQDYINRQDAQKQNGVYLDNVKLLLDQSGHTEGIRTGLGAKLEQIRNMRHKMTETEPIIEYLSHLLRYSRRYLERQEGFDDSCQVEFVVCVPAVWAAQATMHMQWAVEAAIKRSAFLEEDHGCVRNLFMVSEPEAASMCVLESNGSRLKEGSAFVLLDAGGGTVDAACYTVASKDPIRLHREETMAEGVLCGATYLNLALHKKLHEKLNKSDFQDQKVNLDQVIETAVFEFEYGLKRQIDVYDNESRGIHLPGLKEDRSRNLWPDRLYITSKEWWDIFRECLEGVSGLLLRQIDAARAKSLSPKRVIVIGGFGESPSLISHIDAVLKKYNLDHGTSIKRLKTYTASTAVAQGAVLRSIRKANGPARVVQFSYGFKIDEEYAPDHDDENIRRAHLAAKEGKRVKKDLADRVDLIRNTILWTIQKGDVIEPTYAYRYPSTYIFARKEKKLLCELVVFIRDQESESHYQMNHEKNDGARKLASVSVDMTFLRDQDQITPSDSFAADPPHGQGVWIIHLDVVMRVNGLNLSFEACWPRISAESGMVTDNDTWKERKGCESCMAGAFAHGTA